MLKITLTPNRSTGPARYSRIVLYRRRGNKVEAYLAQERGNEVSVDPLPWSKIRASNVEPEFEAAWNEHVRFQAQFTYDAQPTAGNTAA